MWSAAKFTYIYLLAGQREILVYSDYMLDPSLQFALRNICDNAFN